MNIFFLLRQTHKMFYFVVVLDKEVTVFNLFPKVGYSLAKSESEDI